MPDAKGGTRRYMYYIRCKSNSPLVGHVDKLASVHNVMPTLRMRQNTLHETLRRTGRQRSCYGRKALQDPTLTAYALFSFTSDQT